MCNHKPKGKETATWFKSISEQKRWKVHFYPYAVQLVMPLMWRYRSMQFQFEVLNVANQSSSINSKREWFSSFVAFHFNQFFVSNILIENYMDIPKNLEISKILHNYLSLFIWKLVWKIFFERLNINLNHAIQLFFKDRSSSSICSKTGNSIFVLKQSYALFAVATSFIWAR